jgi:dihydrofolate synthase/folylpolyglutamate synthase
MEPNPAARTEPGPFPAGDTRNGQPALNPAEALAFWFGRINYEQRTPQPADLKLERMIALLDRLGNPHRHLRVVHVAGSKGKGSTAALVASILRRAGHCTGLFTSPHLCRVEERIQVDDEPISSRELTALLNEVAPAVRALDAQGAAEHGSATFFEVATAMGFLHFARRGVAAAVVEVGLGGRFDSTNVCRPLAAVITSISYDHTRQLGNRLAQIAMEKAGIAKPGRPVLSGAGPPEARTVIEEICRQRGAPLRQLGAEIRYRHEPGRITADGDRLPRVEVITDRRHWPVMEVGLLGEHQAANAALAVAVVEHLREEGIAIDDQAVATGLAGVRWPARMEVLGRRPMVVLDCAHNVASVQAVVDTLQASFPSAGAQAGKWLLIFASSSDKDLAGMLRVLAPCFDHLYLTRYRHNPRSVLPEQLAAVLGGGPGVAFTTHPTAAEAWQAARAAAGPNDLICVTGSVFLAGELRPLVRGSGDD